MAVDFETFLQAYSTASSAIDSYYNAKNQQLTLKMQASDLRLQQKLGNINASLVDSQIQYMRRASEQKQMLMTLKGSQDKAIEKNKLATGNVDVASGTASERLASMDFKTQVDALTMNANDIMQIEAQQMQKVNYENNAMLAGVKADSLMRISDNISPFGSALQSGVNSAIRYEMNKLMSENIGSYLGGNNTNMLGTKEISKWDFFKGTYNKNLGGIA